MIINLNARFTFLPQGLIILGSKSTRPKSNFFVFRRTKAILVPQPRHNPMQDKLLYLKTLVNPLKIFASGRMSSFGSYPAKMSAKLLIKLCYPIAEIIKWSKIQPSNRYG
jgi:hypothetical protein